MQETLLNKGQLARLLIWEGVKITENGGRLLFGTGAGERGRLRSDRRASFPLSAQKDAPVGLRP
jgi:hypothetical protein